MKTLILSADRARGTRADVMSDGPTGPGSARVPRTVSGVSPETSGRIRRNPEHRARNACAPQTTRPIKSNHPAVAAALGPPVQPSTFGAGRPAPAARALAWAFACAFAAFPTGGLAAEPPTSAEILQQLRAFRETGSVLYVAAHPDDENTQLITYLARGRHIRTAYLSLTRGDGGQNVIGPELGEKLGVIRTQELLAARRIDGAQQFFTRALDFGFSKDVAETLKNWDREQVVSDIVRVIRTFRPDVMITRFSPTAGGTHGHHTASAVLALEAFRRAGDAGQFPEQLKQSLAPWQPKRILWNGGGNNATLRMEVGGNDPATGEPLMAIAARSRAMHKSQGFGNFGAGGPGAGGGSRTEVFTLLDGEPAANDILDGANTTWGRFAGGAEIGALVDDAIAKFKTDDAAASTSAILSMRTKLAALSVDPVISGKRRQLDRILQACLGLEVGTSLQQAEFVPGETISLRHTVALHSNAAVRWSAVRYPLLNAETKTDLALVAQQAVTRDEKQRLPNRAPLTQPYWLQVEPAEGMFKVSDTSQIGRPENPAAFPVEYVFSIGDQTLVISSAPTLPASDTSAISSRPSLAVIPPVSLHFVAEVGIFAPGASHAVEVIATAVRAVESGTLRLDAPDGWNVSPAQQSFRLAAIGEKARFSFIVTAPAQPATATLTASAEIAGARYTTDRIEINYPHIPPQLLQPPAREKLVAFDLAIRGKNIGYLPGAGDDVAACLEQMGYAVTQLTGADITAETLKKFDAVVIGVRAFNVRNDLAPQLPALFAWVENGGTVVAQYNRPGRDLKSDRLAPYGLTLTNDRVTDEHATMTFLAPDHPVLNTPNRITAADFDGWEQERGAYFPNPWDEHFTPILACHDAGEPPMRGSLLVANHGKGYFAYTSLAFFRQLPAGVPGAYRLFANLVSLGQ